MLLLGGLGIYLLLPSLLAVFGAWHSLTHLDWRFAGLVVACEAGSAVALWDLDRTALHTRAWFPVAAAQLSGNAAGRILPGGGATAVGVEAAMLHDAGIDTSDAVGAFGASSMLQLATACALPVLALPAIVGGAPVAHSLATAAYLGAALFVLLAAAGVVAFTTDRPLLLAGRVAQWLLNATVRRRRPVTGLAQTVLDVRDFVRTTIGGHWRRAVGAAVASTGLDYLALLAALRAVGAEPQPSLVLLAYASAELLALVPITPGGLGFVEAGLVGTLSLAGVPARDALAAVLLYRIVAYWLPLPAGGVAYLLFRRRYGAGRGSETPPRGSETAAPASTLAAMPVQLNLRGPVSCTDGPFGVVADVVVDPTTARITHLVVEPRNEPYLARLVPAALVDRDGRPELSLHATTAEVLALPAVHDVAFLHLGEFPLRDPDWDVRVQEVLALPYYPAYEPEPGALGVEVMYDRIPKDEVEIERTSPVFSADGHHLGHVEGFVVDRDGFITQVVLERGRPWDRREVVLPIGAVSRGDLDEIRLTLTKDEVSALPEVPVRRWPSR